jgi:hypothetical protein
MKRFLAALVLLVLSAGAQTRGGWLRGTWEGTGYQVDSASTWTMVLSLKRGRYTVEYPSLECVGRWRLVQVSRTRAIFRETITQGVDKCSNGGRVVLDRLNPRQIGVRFSYQDSREYNSSVILNRRRT